MQALSGLMSCRKVGLRESSSSWRNRSNGRHVCMFRDASPHVLLCVSVLLNLACVFCKFCCRQSLKSSSGFARLKHGVLLSTWALDVVISAWSHFNRRTSSERLSLKERELCCRSHQWIFYGVWFDCNLQHACGVHALFLEHRFTGFLAVWKMKKFMFLGIWIGGGCGEFRSALKVERGKCCATSFLDLHETLLWRSVLQLLERCAQQEIVPEFFP